MTKTLTDQERTDDDRKRQTKIIDTVLRMMIDMGQSGAREEIQKHFNEIREEQNKQWEEFLIPILKRLLITEDLQTLLSLAKQKKLLK